MIKVKSITLREFRGIRNLTLNLHEGNFAVSGPNGTGKSGIVDALEFALTGSISRLAGEGTHGLSVKEHAPHVDVRNRPDKSEVILEASIPHLHKDVKIQRNVKDPKAPRITPDTSDIRKVLAQVATHPEFVLSRRELIKYVLAPAGQRAKEVQELLRLDQIEHVRTSLNKIANVAQKQVKPLKDQKQRNIEHLKRTLEIPELSSKEILEAVNLRRKLLALEPLRELTAKTNLTEGLATRAGKSGQTQSVPKVQAKSDISNARQALSELKSQETKELKAAVLTELRALRSEPALEQLIERDRFLTLALGLIDQDVCPLCDTPIEQSRLRALVEEKSQQLNKVAQQRAELETQLTPLINNLRSSEETLEQVERHAKTLGLDQEAETLANQRGTLIEKRKAIGSFLPLSETIPAVEHVDILGTSTDSAISAIESTVSQLPEPTKQEEAHNYLIVGQERLAEYRDSAFRVQEAEERATLSEKIYDAYNQASNQVLEEIYDQVQKEFSSLYSFINRDDESEFQARLTPSIGKLGFDVDFYGRGYFPPGAYHSEGHQDAMGVCLYLALMKHLLGDGFTFAVLDDVLMSVDAGHRREVCKLLKEWFPNTQFILTTHDSVWLRHMRTAGLIGQHASAQFTRWDVDSGPTDWREGDLWNEIHGYLEAGDVQAAAGHLRRGLEYFAHELCHLLRASVPFKGDAQYELGELLPNAASKFRELIKKGKAAAQSWGDDKLFKELDQWEKDIAHLIDQAMVEQWQVNPAIHYNEWGNFQKEDFVPVVNAQQHLIEAFRCRNCDGFFFSEFQSRQPSTLRCPCGKTSVNLISKTDQKR